MTTQAKQASPEGNRRVCTSAAMIGLAVSVGACIPVAHQADQAIAAEPSSADSKANVSDSFETAAVLTTNDKQSSETEFTASIKHTVQEGQTLWDVARFYGTDASVIAAANGLSLNSVMHVGQILVIPTDTRVAQAIETTSTATPGYYGLVSDQGLVSNQRSESQTIADASIQSSVDADLKAKQSEAVENLKQKRESLRLSLTALNRKASQSAPTHSSATAPSEKATATSEFAADKSSTTLPVTGSQAVTFRPSGQFAQPTTINSVTHRVNPGDTVAAIARAKGISTKQLIEANRISDPNYIFVGQTLVIPQAQNEGFSRNEFNGAIAAVPQTTVSDVSTPTIQPRVDTVAAPKESKSEVVAVAPLRTSSPSPEVVDDSSSRLLQYNHVESLKLEIDRLREKYQSQSMPQTNRRTEARVAAATVERAPSISIATEPVNPEFNPERYSARLREVRDRLNQTQTTPSSTPARGQQSQLVAAAPLGSQNYDPIQAKLGRTVSPELPSLGTGSEFLPGAPSQFEGYIWPTKGVLTSPYGWRWGRMHKGIDIAGPIGTPIVAAADGVVTYAGWNSGGYGYLVEIQHPDGSLTLYGHNNRVLVQVGQQVAQGQQVSEMGSTGYSTGPHLHFEVHPSGKGAVNPMAFLPNKG